MKFSSTGILRRKIQATRVSVSIHEYN